MKQSRVRKMRIQGWINSLKATSPKNEELSKALREIIGEK